jgi:hypothetical protein
MPRGSQARWFPDQPGEWRIELRVECVPQPPRPGTCAGFTEPLIVSTSLWLTGEVSAWGDEHDGLRARLVLATGCADFDRTPIAIQIQNRSGRTRRYNVTGTTMARIPQPFHFTLCASPLAESPGKQLVQSYAQREDIAVITGPGDLMVAHPDGTIRTLVVRPSYWHRTESRMVDEPGEHQVWFEFHFEPSVWTGGDNELWMGQLRTGRLPVIGRARR